MKAHESQLRESLEASHRQANRLDEPGFVLAELRILQDWQRERLARSYADLLSDKQYRAAGHFFLEELYGGLDFRERDREVEHVLPVMIRMLPDHMLISMSDAFSLQAMSLELDIDLADRMNQHRMNSLDAAAYGQLYRESDRFDDRRAQVKLIHGLGMELNELVRHRMVLRLVRLLRLPARAAGFGRLQGFLEVGLFAFRAMRDGKTFVQTIFDRESEILERLENGEKEPFKLQGMAA